MKKSLKLKCRNCNCIIETDDKENVAYCGCRKCSIQLKDDMFFIGSEIGVGGYILLKDGIEYVMVNKEEFENG